MGEKEIRVGVENHAAAVALHFANYNFCRIHKTTRVTPAMAAGVSDQVWGLDELIGLLEIAEEIKCVNAESATKAGQTLAPPDVLVTSSYAAVSV